MVMEVLQNKAQIKSSRKKMIMAGTSCTESMIDSLLRKVGLKSGPVVGDYIKSWDVLRTLEFVEQNAGENDPIVDIGSYASEIIVALHRSGFKNLTGVDLNPELNTMPYNDSIHYEISDFMHTGLKDAAYKVITSISVIEHGFNGDALLKEMSRLLMPGGYFVSSFDYWPKKIDTTGVTFFNMDWKIFSKEDIEQLIKQAEGYGMFPVGKLSYEGADTPIDCGGKKYTFGWLALQKAS